MVRPASPPVAGAPADRTGVGVAGAAAAAGVLWAGAAGGAGVDVEDWAAGVAGTAAFEDSAAGAGAALGCLFRVWSARRFMVEKLRPKGPAVGLGLGLGLGPEPERTLLTTQTTKPFSSIL